MSPSGLRVEMSETAEKAAFGSCNPCFAWRNHGEFVRCVAHYVESQVLVGAISEEQGEALLTLAAQSEVGKKGFVPVGCK